MRRVLFSLILLCMFFTSNVSFAENIAQGVKVIVIDAGHGGPKFPGATYRGVHEKDLNLKVALKLGALIEKRMPDVKVVYTRKTDMQFSADLNKDLQARADIANKAEGDLFLSIHTNAARSTAARGVETLIMGESPLEKRLNDEVLFANNKEEFIDMSDQKTAAIVRAYIENLRPSEPVRNDWSELNRWEYGLGVGVGIEIWKFQVIGRYNWNFGSLYGHDDASEPDTSLVGIMREAFSRGHNLGGFTLSVSLLF